MRALKSFTASALTAAVIVCSFVSSIAPANAAEVTPTGVENIVADSNNQQVKDIFRLINEYRATKELTPVTYNVYVSEMSQDWTDHMAANETFEHNTGNYSDQIDARAHGWSGSGEIIAARWDRSAEGIVQQWIDSPAHNSIISSADLNTVGIGVTFTDGTPETTPNRYAMFGTVNFFRYDKTVQGTYKTPDDFFAGNSPILIATSPKAPQQDSVNYTYTIPFSNEVQYFVDGSPVSDGVYAVNPGSYTVTAAPLSGYVFPEGTQSTWTFQYKVKDVEVTPIAPTFAATNYTIPAQSGVEYKVNGVLKASGTYSANSLVSVNAVALPGYVLNGVTAWSKDYTPAIIVVTAKEPVVDLALRTYTIPSVTGVEYLVDEIYTPSGVYKVSSEATDITVTVRAQAGYQLASGEVWGISFPVETVVPTPVPAPTQLFRDVPLSHDFYKEISWMKQEGISTGWADGTYRPLTSTTREAMAAFMYRMAGKPSYTPPVKPFFKDVPVSHPFYKEISWMASKGISTGWSERDGSRSYRPLTSTTREAMAAFMYRMAGKPSYTAPSTSPFRDVSTSGDFYKEISWMKDSRISTGWADGTYRPATFTKRDAMSAFLYRYYHKFEI